MAALITVAEADMHLGIDLQTDGGSPPTYTDERLSYLQLQMEVASEAVISYLKYDDTTWDDYTVPKEVKQAVLLVLAAYWWNRGDDAKAVDPFADNGAVANLLRQRRDPALA